MLIHGNTFYNQIYDTICMSDISLLQGPVYLNILIGYQCECILCHYIFGDLYNVLFV